MEGETKYSDFILYGYWRSSCAWRVRLALLIKGIDFTYKPINLFNNEQQSEEYLKINQFGRVPLLEFTETKGEISTKVKLTESAAIIEFIEDIFPNKYPLLPKDPIQKAKVKAFCYHIGCNIQPLQNLSTLKKVESLGGDKLEWAFDFINRNLSVLEKDIINTMGKYCFGDSITLADIYLIPQLYFFKRFNRPLTDYPNLDKIRENLEKVDTIIKGDAINQIDAEK